MNDHKEINKNDYYREIKTGKIVKIIDFNKVKIDGNWYMMVNYSNINLWRPSVYRCKTKQGFIKSFEKCEKPSLIKRIICRS